MKQLRSNRKRVIYEIIILWVALALLLVTSLVLPSLEYSILSSLNFHEYNALIFITFFFSIIISFLSIATFIQWFRRAYFNLSKKVSTLKYTDRVVNRCWYIPIVNLYLPYKMIKELFRETEKLLKQNGIVENLNLSKKSLFGWWAIYVMTLYFPFLFLVYEKLPLMEMFYYEYLIIGILFAFTTINLIKKYSKIEALLSIETQKTNIVPKKIVDTASAFFRLSTIWGIFSVILLVILFLLYELIFCDFC